MFSQPIYRVIILEDNPVDAELIELELRKCELPIECIHAASADDFSKELAGEQVPDLVLADYTLPGFDGMAALHALRNRYPYVPFVFVSGSLGEERAIEALKSGATDYVLKDRLGRLPAVVVRAFRELFERRERHISHRDLAQHRQLLTAIIDSLPESIYAVDELSRITVINKAMLTRLKRQRSTTIGKLLSELQQPHAHELELMDAMVLRSGRALLEKERTIENEDGSISWLMSSRIPLRDQHDKVIGVVCTERDLTQRRQMQREILDISNREQRRLGSDLHDGLGQELTGLSLMIKGLEIQMSQQESAYLPQIAKINELISSAIQSTRSLARGAAPVSRERGGITEALRQLAARCTDIYHLPCHFTNKYNDHNLLDDNVATQIYRIAQEATTNAARHAHAGSVEIELRSTERRLYLSITDDGIGMNSQPDQSQNNHHGKSGLGIRIMEYRASILGGSIQFERLPAGTRVRLSCPLKAPGTTRSPKQAEKISARQ